MTSKIKIVHYKLVRNIVSKFFSNLSGQQDSGYQTLPDILRCISWLSRSCSLPARGWWRGSQGSSKKTPPICCCIHPV